MNSYKTFIDVFENWSMKFRSSYRFPGNNSGKVNLVPIFWNFLKFSILMSILFLSSSAMKVMQEEVKCSLYQVASFS